MNDTGNAITQLITELEAIQAELTNSSVTDLQKLTYVMKLLTPFIPAGLAVTIQNYVMTIETTMGQVQASNTTDAKLVILATAIAPFIPPAIMTILTGYANAMASATTSAAPATPAAPVAPVAAAAPESTGG